MGLLAISIIEISELINPKLKLDAEIIFNFMLIVFEGIDRSGKSTQVKRLFNHLFSGVDFRVAKSREPWNDEIRKYLKRHTLSPDEQLDLILTDRASHCFFIEDLFNMGLNVMLCDRYTPSTLAYQGYGHGLDLAMLRKRNEKATGGLEPDLVLLFDCPVSVAVNRGEGRPLDKIEQDILFLERVRLGYLELMGNEKNYHLIDAAQSEDSVFDQVVGAVMPLLNRCLTVA